MTQHDSPTKLDWLKPTTEEWKTYFSLGYFYRLHVSHDLVLYYQGWDYGNSGDVKYAWGSGRGGRVWVGFL